MITAEFGIELDQRLRGLGLALSGHWPEFRVGLFTLEVSEGEVTIWYGHKQERLSRCSTDPAKIAQRVARLKDQLGSPGSPEEFLQKLYLAYQAVKGSRDTVPIMEVFSELSRKFRHYTRADFSYDLYRARARDVASKWGLHLTVATRAFTRQRKDFLWVPDDETGRGTAYSHLSFKNVEGGDQMTKHITIVEAEQASAEAKAEQAKAADQAVAAEARAQAIEQAWATLLSAGVITQEDRKVLEGRAKDRKILALAADALARARELAPDVVSVSVVAGSWVYLVEDGQPGRVLPRTTTTTRRKASKANEPKASEAKPEAGEADIPTEVLRKASEELGVKWYGRSNALRSQRVVAKARELLGQS